jgi:hypothetical protein
MRLPDTNLSGQASMYSAEQRRTTTKRGLSPRCLEPSEAAVAVAGSQPASLSFANATTFAALGSHHVAQASIIVRRFSSASPRR